MDEFTHDRGIQKNGRIYFVRFQFTELSRKDVSKFEGSDAHDRIVYFHNPAVGLQGFFAIHRIRNEAAIGGTRLASYRKREDALKDALRLSRAMTYKCAMAGIPMGGGKAVIMRPSAGSSDRRAFFGAYADALNMLGGFYTGEDVGVTQDDVEVMAARSRLIVGRPGIGGDPGPWAARSVYHALRTALSEVYGNANLSKRRFAVKGLGNVGLEVAKLLSRNGGVVLGADIDPGAVAKAKKEIRRIEIVHVKNIHKAAVDAYIPCALGGEFDRRTISELNCLIVCGSANNQLATPEDHQRLADRGILYIPDYIANAGGLINVAAELDRGGYRRAKVEKKVRDIGLTVQRIIRMSQKQKKTPSQVADQLAESIFSASVMRKQKN